MPRKQKKQRKEDSENRFFYLLLIVLIGPAVIGGSIATGYYVGVLFGLALIFWGIWETPEIHPNLKLIINWKGRKSAIQIRDSPGSQAVAVAGDRNQILLGQPNQRLRELAQQVYTPLIREGTSGLENNRYVTQIFAEWDRLKQEAPYWTAQVPPDIVEMLESAKPSYDRLGTLTPEFQKIVSNVSFQAIEKVGLQSARPGMRMVSFRILQGDVVVRWVYVSSFWESGKFLKELVQEHVKYPDIGFTVDLQIDGQPVGNGEQAYQLADTIHELLKKEPIAVEVRDRTIELRKRAVDVVSRIREELKKG